MQLGQCHQPPEEFLELACCQVEHLQRLPVAQLNWVALTSWLPPGSRSRS